GLACRERHERFHSAEIEQQDLHRARRVLNDRKRKRRVQWRKAKFLVIGSKATRIASNWPPKVVGMFPTTLTLRRLTCDLSIRYVGRGGGDRTIRPIANTQVIDSTFRQILPKRQKR